MDQELQRMQRANDITRTRLATGSWRTLLAAASGGRKSWKPYKSMTTYQKSDFFNQCVFTPGTILSNFIPIRFETM